MSASTPDPSVPADGAAASDPHWLPPRPKRDRSLVIAGSAVALLLVVGLAFTLFSSTGLLSSHNDKVVTIGTTEGSADYWPILKRLAKDKGITIETVNFSEYTQPNPALAQGQIDLNLFQHLVFLANYNVSSSQNLTPIGSTVVVPLALYSRQYSSVQQIPSGAQIAIPNDPTNQSRALLVLQQAGLISLRGGGSIISTPTDILPESRVRVVPVSAQQTVTSLPSVAGAVINNGFANDANIDPQSAIYKDDPDSPAAEPYINAFVSRAADKDNPTYKEIVELYHSPEVTKSVVDASKGTAVIVNKPADQLEAITAKLEEQIRDK
ncbi:MetQ/NlpA family ABC transporter substrate-binding protein [Gordonia sp. NPDC003425]